jgi:conjugal transfer pilus assembly protein TraB
MKKNIGDFFNKLKEIVRGKDDYYLDTYDDTDKKIKGKFYAKLGKWFIILPIFLLVTVILYKAVPAIIQLKLQKANLKTEEKKPKNTEIVFSNDEMWKMQSEEKQKKLEININEVKTDVKEIKDTIKTSFENLNTNVEKSIKSNQENIENIKSELSNEIKTTKNDVENFKNDNKINIEKLKNDINSNNFTADTNNEPTKLDPNKLIQFNPQKPQEITSIENNQVQNEQIPKIEIITNEKEVEYLDLGESAISINTLDKAKVVDETIKEFHLIGGFSIATLLTGGNFSTMSEGEKETIPVTLSLNTKLKTPNNEEMDLRECFVRGTGKADFTSKTAQVTLTNIQCNLTDSKGDTYIIDEEILGWLWDENGEYGVKGRLITNEGEIISKALPLAFMQTAMEIMTNNSQKTTDKEGVISFTGTASTFGSNASDTIIDKIGDKWMKYMDGLNPKVNLRPGRQLVVQFKGGEKLKIKKIDPADIGNFKKSLEKDDNYEE